MLHYFAVIKIRPDASPMKATFIANDVTDALKEMCRVANCTTTNEIAEYDLLQVMSNNKYKEVASKIGNEIRKRPIETSAPVLEEEEKQYIPYTLATHEDKVL